MYRSIFTTSSGGVQRGADQLRSVACELCNPHTTLLQVGQALEDTWGCGERPLLRVRVWRSCEQNLARISADIAPIGSFENFPVYED